jgi:hypothetical protein
MQLPSMPVKCKPPMNTSLKPRGLRVGIGTLVFIETVPYLSRKGLEMIIGELAPTEPKAKQAKPEDFIDHRFVSQLEMEGFFKNAALK